MTLRGIDNTPRPSRRPGRPAALDAERIAEAVLELGFRDLTFARLAHQLDVGQATLYRHASNRDALVRLGLDLAVRRFEWPQTDGPWKPMLERISLASWHAWSMYPGAVSETTRGVVPAAMVELSDRVGVALIRQGFTARHAVQAVDLVFDLAADSSRGAEEMDSLAQQRAGAGRQGYETGWAPPPGGDPRVLELRSEMVRAIREDPEAWFRGKLRIVLAGIQQELAPPDPPSTTTSPSRKRSTP